ncbi:MAG: hypothetical protein GY711_26945 [bacterium]|nr:hypothetical protein [bacterium]
MSEELERPSSEPSFARLLAANLRVVGVAVLVMVAAYGTWRGLARLFPDVSWLQP